MPSLSPPPHSADILRVADGRGSPSVQWPFKRSKRSAHGWRVLLICFAATLLLPLTRTNQPVGADLLQDEPGDNLLVDQSQDALRDILRDNRDAWTDDLKQRAESLQNVWISLKRQARKRVPLGSTKWQSAMESGLNLIGDFVQTVREYGHLVDECSRQAVQMDRSTKGGEEPEISPASAQLPSSGQASIKTRTNLPISGPVSQSTTALPPTHPLPAIIREANEAWISKLERQSTTLQEAVTEYRARYGRPPPTGFDKWYAFAVERGTKLVDEYDRITKDIEQLLGMPAELVRRRARAISENEDRGFHQRSFTLRIVDGRVQDTLGPDVNTRAMRASDQVKLLSSFVQWLPDMNVTYWAHDGPALPTAGENKALYASLARSHMLLPEAEWNNAQDDASLVGWERMCPPESRTRNKYSIVDSITSASPSVFVRDHAEAIDFCQHPEMLDQHSYTIRNGLGPRPTLHRAIFSHSKTTLHSDICVPNLSQFSKQEPGRPIAWLHKLQDKVLWRGSTTGIYSARAVQWRASQRSRLNLLTNYQNSTRDLLLCGDQDRVAWVLAADVGDVNSDLFDIAFTGEPMQCDKADGTCAAMQDAYRFAAHIWHDEANEYKYVMDVDGNAWSGRFRRLLISGSAVLKSTATIEWWQDRIQPWVHYIPIRGDYSDLHHAMTFFTGYKGLHAHDDVAENIAKAGQQWVNEFWRYEDLEVYLFRLYLEYARVLDRSLDYVANEATG